MRVIFFFIRNQSSTAGIHLDSDKDGGFLGVLGRDLAARFLRVLVLRFSLCRANANSVYFADTYVFKKL